MPTPISRPAFLALRGRLDRHLREHGWSGTEAFWETEIDAVNLCAFLLAALDFVREEHPLPDPAGAVPELSDSESLQARSALLAAFPGCRHPVSVDVCIDALARVVPFEVAGSARERRQARPRAYAHCPGDWPAILSNVVDWTDSVFGVVAEDGWLAHQAHREQVFRALCPAYYEDESFSEIQGDTASRLAAFLLAGPDHRASVAAYEAPARVFVELFGSRSRAFANRSFDVHELEDPFAHARTTCWSAGGLCSSGKQLILIVTDGTLLAQLRACWDISAE